MKPSGFYVDPFLRCSLILIPSIQHEKSDYLFQDNRFFLSDPSGLCESGIILLIINLLFDVIEKQCTTVCTTFSALFWRAKLPLFSAFGEYATNLTLIIRIFAD